MRAKQHRLFPKFEKYAVEVLLGGERDGWEFGDESGDPARDIEDFLAWLQQGAQADVPEQVPPDMPRASDMTEQVESKGPCEGVPKQVESAEPVDQSKPVVSEEVKPVEATPVAPVDSKEAEVKPVEATQVAPVDSKEVKPVAQRRQAATVSELLDFVSL